MDISKKQTSSTPIQCGKEGKGLAAITKLPTLLEAIERVVELSKNSQMNDEFLLDASPEICILPIVVVSPSGRPCCFVSSWTMLLVVLTLVILPSPLRRGSDEYCGTIG